MSSNTKVYEDKMKSSVEHLGRELGAVRAGRANPAVLDKVSVDYYGAPTPIQQVASVAVAEARTLTITPWDRTLLRPISKAIMASDVGITPIDDGSTIRLRVTVNDPAFVKEQALKALPCSGVVQNGCDVQIVYGIRAPEVRQAVERRLGRVVC